MSQDSTPAFADWMGIGAAAAGEGAECAMSPGQEALGRPGVLHGGAIATLLEQAGRSAVVAALGQHAATVELASMTVDYLRVGPATRSLASAAIVKLGGRVAVVSANAWADNREKPFAAAKMTFIIKRSDDTRPGGESAPSPQTFF